MFLFLIYDNTLSYPLISNDLRLKNPGKKIGASVSAYTETPSSFNIINLFYRLINCQEVNGRSACCNGIQHQALP